VNPPIKKRKTEDKTLYYSEYESSKRVRSYSTEWEKDRPWLKLTDDGIVCPTCQATRLSWTNLSVVVSYKLDSIQKHQKLKILNFLKANPAFWAYLKKVELHVAKKESIFFRRHELHTDQNNCTQRQRLSHILKI